LDSDDQTAPIVAVVNEALAKKFFRGRDCLGLTLDTGNGDARIIGVAGTAKYRSLGESPLPYVYLCAWQRTERNMTLAVRSTGDPNQLSRAIGQVAAALDPDSPPHASMSCQDYIQSSFTVARVAVVMLTFL